MRYERAWLRNNSGQKRYDGMSRVAILIVRTTQSGNELGLRHAEYSTQVWLIFGLPSDCRIHYCAQQSTFLQSRDLSPRASWLDDQEVQ
jgi:hypothetical protein